MTDARALEAPPALDEKTFDKVRRLIYDRVGIDLRQGKQALVAARLGKKVRESGSRGYADYVDRVLADRTGESMLSLIDALTTNHTCFLREAAHFDFLRRTILPRLAVRRQFDIWCAASATGEEPYSLAFTVLDALGTAAVTQCRILATDISTKALAHAREGVYTSERLRDLPPGWLSRYLVPHRGPSGGYHQVRAEVRSMVLFRRLNLIESYSHPGRFPLISCRNVMIYFDKPTQERVVRRLEAFLDPGGYLFIGHAESLAGTHHNLQYICPAVYRAPGADRTKGAR